MVLVCALALALTACADHMGRVELLERIEAGNAPPIVDVRSGGEFEASHVPGAVHIPFYTLLGNSDSIPEPLEPGDPVVIYCEHGPRAGMARAQLWMVNRRRPVVFLEGHMTAWKRDGLPVESSSGLAD